MNFKNAALTAMVGTALMVGTWMSGTAPASAAEQPVQVAGLSINIHGRGIYISKSKYRKRHFGKRHYRKRNRGKRYYHRRHYDHGGSYYRHSGRYYRHGGHYVNRDGSSCMYGGCYAAGR